MKSLYLLINAITISFPLIRSFESKVKYSKKWIALFPAIGLTASFFILWDIIFTQNGVWGFNHKYLLDWYIWELPIEEWLFFVTVPFASVFIYECIRVFIPRFRSGSVTRTLSTAFSLILILTAIYHSDKAYTFWSFIFTGVFLSIISLQKERWFGKFWLAYFLHLIPFLLVNGVLTGSFIDEPVVWYNDEQNLGIRLFTIPIEDTMYALLLLLMNVTFFEYFKKKFI